MTTKLLLGRLGPLIGLWLCTGASGAPESPQSPAEQEGAAKLRQEWKVQSAQQIQKAQNSNVPVTALKGGFYPGQVRILKDLLNAAPAALVEAEFQRVCVSEIPKSYHHGENWDTNYDYVLIALVERNVERKDAQHLTKLLSQHCPREVVYCPIEFYLAYEWSEGIERLFDGYATAQTPSAKDDIVYCLGRAFPALRNLFPVDGEFVREARAWYVANKATLKPNKHYRYIPSLPAFEPAEDRTNLFLHSSK